MLKVARNVAIIALLALGLTVLPGGGNITDGILMLLTLILAGAAGLLAVRLWRQTGMTRDVMTDRQRGLLYGALGAIALMIAGADELLDTGAGTVAWLLILGVSIWMIYVTWREANTI